MKSVSQNYNLYLVEGCSMEPTIQNGQIVEVLDDFRDGDIVVAEIARKLVIKRLNGWLLQGDNREMSVDFPAIDARILGRAVVRTPEYLEERGLQSNTLSYRKVVA